MKHFDTPEKIEALRAKGMRYGNGDLPAKYQLGLCLVYASGALQGMYSKVVLDMGITKYRALRAKEEVV